MHLGGAIRNFIGKPSVNVYASEDATGLAADVKHTVL